MIKSLEERLEQARKRLDEREEALRAKVATRAVEKDAALNHEKFSEADKRRVSEYLAKLAAADKNISRRMPVRYRGARNKTA